MPATRLSPEQLHTAADPARLGITSSDELEELEAATGQDRAVAAIEFGVGMPREGYNLYVAGPPGIGFPSH
jgi:hypothetical protein